jgi:hypothetical protein
VAEMLGISLFTHIKVKSHIPLFWWSKGNSGPANHFNLVLENSNYLGLLLSYNVSGISQGHLIRGPDNCYQAFSSKEIPILKRSPDFIPTLLYLTVYHQVFPSFPGRA